MKSGAKIWIVVQQGPFQDDWPIPLRVFDDEALAHKVAEFLEKRAILNDPNWPNSYYVDEHDVYDGFDFNDCVLEEF